ncbi:hypothetical protein KUV62_21580 [Salipiger bermudensis]|uniref:hypothetical protein n=1 Tax=Salipiger bermudensis TaxID=344736 RepID=UPI001C99B76A|nr:hypothetical protein [Salipiger bermudensis]MBY6006530.1 hypothetical protein [Salipiger bermudensis]
MTTPTRIIGLRPIRLRLRLLAPLQTRLRARRARRRLAQLRRSPALARDIGLPSEPPPNTPHRTMPRDLRERW